MTTWNEGVLEGLKIARVFVKNELLLSPQSKKLCRIFIEISNEIEAQESQIKKQQESVSMQNMMRSLTE